MDTAILARRTELLPIEPVDAVRYRLNPTLHLLTTVVPDQAPGPTPTPTPTPTPSSCPTRTTSGSSGSMPPGFSLGAARAVYEAALSSASSR